MHASCVNIVDTSTNEIRQITALDGSRVHKLSGTRSQATVIKAAIHVFDFSGFFSIAENPMELCLGCFT